MDTKERTNTHCKNCNSTRFPKQPWMDVNPMHFMLETSTLGFGVFFVKLHKLNFLCKVLTWTINMFLCQVSSKRKIATIKSKHHKSSEALSSGRFDASSHQGDGKGAKKNFYDFKCSFPDSCLRDISKDVSKLRKSRLAAREGEQPQRDGKSWRPDEPHLNPSSRRSALFFPPVQRTDICIYVVSFRHRSQEPGASTHTHAHTKKIKN